MFNLRAWVKEFRLLFLIYVIVPVILGSIISYKYYPEDFSVPYFLLSIVAILLLHAGTIAYNDYFDFKSGADVINENRTPYTGGTGLLVDNVLKPSHVVIVGTVCFILCIIIGLYIVFARSIMVLPIGIAGVAMGIFYTAPPLKLSYHGAGELMWFLSTPLMALGALYVQKPVMSISELIGTYDAALAAVITTLPIAFLSSSGLLILEFPDHDADRAARKNNLIVLMGRKNFLYMFILVSLLSYISLMASVISGSVTVKALFTLVSVPVMILTVIGLIKFYMKPQSMVRYIELMSITIIIMSIAMIVALLF
ncbi:prenyltransferase [Methanooceanicella nereidis]|nr:prenyltransferase [Methanocella sp. CWC-04]